MFDFKIQAGSPAFKNQFDKIDESIGDIDDIGWAIETSFPLVTEYIIIFWNYVPFCIGYKYDMGEILDDLLRILKELRTSENGELTNVWTSNTFASTWKFKWSNGEVEIEAQWESECGGVIGHTEELLSKCNIIKINKVDFAREWKMVFLNLIKGLEKAGYDERLPGFPEFKKEFNAIDKYGVLYE